LSDIGLHVRRLLALLLLLALSTGAAAQRDQKGPAFEKCDAEGFLALNIARNYLLGGKKKQSVLPYISDNPLGQALFAELERRVAAGEFKQHYADFATDKLYTCADREGLSIGEPRSKTRICYARVDIPFFLYVDRQKEAPKEQAIRNTRRILPATDLYPQSLIEAVADQVYAARDGAQVKRLMGTVLWSCVYSDQLKKK
jgi:hypothetical protein